jgi:ribosomal protein S18 acetylase RimI-like enzyme
MLPFRIRSYERGDEEQWLRCRALSFLHTAYYDDVLREKPSYDNRSIELVAVDQDVVGFLDIEVEAVPGTICDRLPGLGGMIWNFGVHPDHRRRAIARHLLDEGTRRARAMSMTALEAWTRDDAAARALYEAAGFRQVFSYWHVYLEGDQLPTSIPGLHPVQVFAHYLGPDIESVRPHCRRVHECVCYQREL